MFLFFDVETTGLPKDRFASIKNTENWPRIVQIAWLLYDINESKLHEKTFLIKPEGFTIPASATQIHGITTEKALNSGAVLEITLKELAVALKQSDYVIAHNIDFDSKVLGAEFIRAKIQNDLFKKRHICTMKSSADFCKIRQQRGYKWPNLSELHYKLFRQSFVEAHDALIDVAACAKCFFELKKRKIIAIP